MQDLIPFGFVAFIIVLIGGVAYLAYRYEKKRAEALRTLAMELGWDYLEEASELLLSELAVFPLFTEGHRRRGRNQMQGRPDGNPMLLMDYQYTTGSGKHQHTHQQTVAIFPLQHGRLPVFQLSPENILHKIGSAFGYQDIDFEENKVFSDGYLLRGQDEQSIRAFFTSSRLELMAQNQGWCIQCVGDRMLVYRADKRCSPEELRAFVDEVCALKRRFLGR